MDKSIHVFFSFYYSYDYQRVCQVMEAWAKQENTSCTPFITDAEIVEMKKAGLGAIHKWVDEEIAKADAVVVLIGAKSYNRYFIDYEIYQALLQGKPLLGAYIHELSDEKGNRDEEGESPMPAGFATYNWQGDNAAAALAGWIAEAESKKESQYLALPKDYITKLGDKLQRQATEIMEMIKKMKADL